MRESDARQRRTKGTNRLAVEVSAACTCVRTGVHNALVLEMASDVLVFHNGIHAQPLQLCLGANARRFVFASALPRERIT